MAKRKARCMFGNDTCDGIKGTSGFICRDCNEEAEFDAQLAEERRIEKRQTGAIHGPACEVIELFDVETT